MRYMDKKKELTIVEFAGRVGLSHDTILRMVKLKRIKGFKKNPLGRNSPIMIPASELEKYKEKNVTA